MKLAVFGPPAAPTGSTHSTSGGNGDVETPLGTPGFTFRTSAGSAQVLRDALTSVGTLITGRRNFDIAGGRGGQHPLLPPSAFATFQG